MKEFTMLGIYDNGEILTVDKPYGAFLPDAAETFALIRNIHGEPLGEVIHGVNAYNPSDVDYELGRITDLSTWKMILENGFADCLKDQEDNALRFLLKSRYPISSEIFDLVYAAYPETRLDDILWLCNRLKAAEWALAHGADKNYAGLVRPMKDVMAYQHNMESPAIFECLYGCTQEEYQKELENRS